MISPCRLLPFAACLLFLVLSPYGVEAQGNETDPSMEASSGNETMPIDELAGLYLSTIGQFAYYPPEGDRPNDLEGTKAIQVAASIQFTSIDTISPGESEFTVSYRAFMMWNKAQCNQSRTHARACDPDKGTDFQFFTAPSLMGSSSNKYRMKFENLNAGVYQDAGLDYATPDGILIEQQSTFSKTFNVKYYPYEYHELELSFLSFYSNNLLELTTWPEVEPGGIKPSVPPGWSLEGIRCEVSLTDGNRQTDEVGGGEFELLFGQLSCKIGVSRYISCWKMNTFFLPFCILHFIDRFLLLIFVAEQPLDGGGLLSCSLAVSF